MTTRERLVSRVRGCALTSAVAAGRCGSVLSDDQAVSLWERLGGAGRLADPVYTGGGAVVTFTRHGTGYRVSVSASAI